ncbi:oocyte zinc finger protein XlCOF28-like isoform X2 [Macrobrachium rosenbergii]
MEIMHHIKSHMSSNTEGELCDGFKQTYITENSEEKVDDEIEEIDVTDDRKDNDYKETAITGSSEGKLHKESEETNDIDILSFDIRKSKNPPEKSENATHHVSSESFLNLLEEDLIITGNKERPYMCRKCKKNIRHLLNFKSHMKVHTLAKKYSCPVCNKTFPYDCKLKKHMMRHSATKTHICKVCEKAFLYRKELAKHMRNHSCKKDNVNAGISSHPPKHKTTLSIKGLCRQNNALKRKKENPQDSLLGSCNVVSILRNHDYNTESNLHFNGMENGIPTLSLGKKCSKPEEHDSLKDNLKLEMRANPEENTLRTVESDKWTRNKKLLCEQEKEAESVTLKQEYPDVEVSREFYVKEVDIEKQESSGGPCTERGNFKEEQEMDSDANCDEKGVPYLNFINELIIVDELVTDEIYENATDPLM